MRTTTILLVLCVAGLAFANDYSTSGIEYDHVLHSEMDLGCEYCHAEAWESEVGTDLLLPAKDTCADCHDVESEDNCGYCHVDVDDPWGYAETVAKVDLFSHAAHVEDEESCASCHGQVDALVAAPPKADCRSCHVTAADLQDCSVCHSQGAEYVPESHETAGYEYWHGVEAGHMQQDCSNCHAQVDCQDCHSGDNVAPRVHRESFAFDHAWEARGSMLECSTCHVDAGFCADCHRTNNVLPRNHSRADWLLPTGDGGAHGTEALLEMEGCISCHDSGASDPLCADCHGGSR